MKEKFKRKTKNVNIFHREGYMIVNKDVKNC